VFLESQIENDKEGADILQPGCPASIVEPQNGQTFFVGQEVTFGWDTNGDGILQEKASKEENGCH